MVKRLLRSIFFPAKSERLAKEVSIESPAAFQQSIKKLQKGGLTAKEKKALVLARTRASVQLKRKDLSMKEFQEFGKIAKTKIPKLNK